MRTQLLNGRKVPIKKKEKFEDSVAQPQQEEREKKKEKTKLLWLRANQEEKKE